MTVTHADADIDSQRRGAFGWYVLILLTLAYIFALVDRQVLSLLVEPIKHDLGITDTRMGMLQGVAFGIFYTVAGVPLGYAADRLSRRTLLGCSILAWSLMTAACGLAGTYVQLLAARVGVSIGEAALGPTAVPLIRDVVPGRRFARATAIYMLGIPLGSGLAILAGATLLPVFKRMGPVGWPLIGVLQPWQATFVAVASPGLLIGLLMLALPDPLKRRCAVNRSTEYTPSEVFAFLRKHWRTFLGFGLPGIAATMMVFGIGFWIPAVFSRHFGLAPQEVAGYLRAWGLMSLVLGVAGALLGGACGDSIRRRRDDGFVVLAAIALVVMSVSYGLFCFAPDAKTALIILMPAAFAGIVPPIMAAAAAVEMAPIGMRSVIAAIWSPLFTLVGVGFGPAIVAFTSLAVFHRESALTRSIPLVTAVLTAFALPLLVLVRRPYCGTVADAESINRTAH